MSYGTYGHQLERWRVLVNNLKSTIDTVPQAAADRIELEQLIHEVQKLSAEIEVAGGALRILTERRRKVAHAARQKRLVIAAHLKGHFGLDHPALLSFGIEPRVPKKRAKKTKAGGAGAGEQPSEKG